MKLFSIIAFVVVFIITSLLIFIEMQKDTIKVGLLYSKSGTMATEERVIGAMVHYAIEQINQKGGVLSQKVEIIEYDGASNPNSFKQGAKFLIEQGVKSIFGCWTSASRKAIIPVIERANVLLFYPVQYEGFENSKNIIYLGLSANQQLNPMITFITAHYGKRIYFVGSDYIYPRMSFLYLQELSHLVGIEIVGSHFEPLGSRSFKSVAKDIADLKPDAIINTLNGDSNSAFFKSLHPHNTLPIFSTSIDESSLSTMHLASLQGHYIVSSYFNALAQNDNTHFKAKIKKRFGKDFILTESAYNAYLGVEFWARAVKNAQSSTNIAKIQELLAGDSLKSITGINYIDRNNNHLHKVINIAKIKDTTTHIVWNSQIVVKPYPFPIFKTQTFWLEHQKRLYHKWDQNWQYIPKGAR
jgi:urea transport system substrate-binding protein